MALRCRGCPSVIPKELPQLVAQPGQQGLEHSWMPSEEGRPDMGLEAAHRIPLHWSSCLWSEGMVSRRSPWLLGHD